MKIMPVRRASGSFIQSRGLTRFGPNRVAADIEGIEERTFGKIDLGNMAF